MLIDMSIGIVCDFFPVMLLMIYHYRNFKDKETGSQYGDTLIDESSEEYIQDCGIV